MDGDASEGSLACGSVLAGHGLDRTWQTSRSVIIGFGTLPLKRPEAAGSGMGHDLSAASISRADFRFRGG
jgi:hypothetical protein